MVDFSTIGISVCVTLTLQSVYLGLIRFPKILKTEANALSSAARLLTEYGKETFIGNSVANEAIEACLRANETLLDAPSEAKRDALIWDLTILLGKLDGWAVSREPEATHLRNVSKGIERTLTMVRDLSLTDSAIRLEASYIANISASSLKSTSYRINEERLRIADDIEQRATNLDSSLLEFWGAAAISYIGVLALSAWILHSSVFFSHSYTWAKILVWIVVASIMSPIMVFFRTIGDAAKNIVEASEAQVNQMRSDLLRLK